MLVKRGTTKCYLVSNFQISEKIGKAQQNKKHPISYMEQRKWGKIIRNMENS